MRDPGDHPQLLLWYVSGDLDEARARRTAAHLRRCAGCSSEASALRSMMEMVTRQREEDGADGPILAVSPGPLEARIRPPPSVSMPHARDGRPAAGRAAGAALWIAAAVLGFLLLTVPAAWRLRAVPSVMPAIRSAHHVTFPAAPRGFLSGRVLEGGGPWAVTLLLPPGAPEGTYGLRVEKEGDGGLAGFHTTLPSDGSGRLTVLLQDLPGAGRYLIVLEPVRSEPAGTSYAYPFELMPGEPAGGSGIAVPAS